MAAPMASSRSASRSLSGMLILGAPQTDATKLRLRLGTSSTSSPEYLLLTRSASPWFAKRSRSRPAPDAPLTPDASLRRASCFSTLVSISIRPLEPSHPLGVTPQLHGAPRGH